MANPHQRFDERDNVFARFDLKPDTEFYNEYYTAHPELKAIDDKIRTLPGLGAHASGADSSMFYSAAELMLKIGSPEYVDGVPSGKKIVLSPERAAQKVKAFARLLGADLTGISELNQAHVYSNRGRQKYLDQEPWGMKIEVPHKYAISLGFKEDLQMVRTGPHFGEMLESGMNYMRSAVTSVILADFIRKLGYPARAHHFRNYGILSVPPAVDGGLGELGRCGFLVTKRYGNCLRLSTVSTDLPLATDSPMDIGMEDFCNRCKLCSEACPSGSIPIGGKKEVRGVRKWQMNPESCYEFWNKVGTDCGICIGSCPWSQPQNLLHRTSAELASRSKIARVLLLWAYPIVYGEYRPVKSPDWLDGE